jgi:hypothetical protein
VYSFWEFQQGLKEQVTGGMLVDARSLLIRICFRLLMLDNCCLLTESDNELEEELR